MNKFILNSVPKSGTHVLVKVFELLKQKDSHRHLSGSLVRNQVGNLRWFPRKLALSFDLLNKTRLMVDLDNPCKTISIKRFNSYIKNIEPCSYTQGHLPYSEDLDHFLVQNGFKLVQIVRDPRSLVASYINHVIRDVNYPHHNKLKSIESERARVEFVLNGDTKNSSFILAPLSGRLRNAAGWLGSPTNCVVKFEDLVGPNGGGSTESQRDALSKIISFANIELSELELVGVADQIFDRKSETFHRGHVDGMQGFEAETKEFIDRELKDWVRVFGYEAR